VNLIVIDKQPQLQWLGMDEASEHCRRGASIWSWAITDGGAEPDVILASAGDIPTMETLAAAWWLRRLVPEMRVRVVNVVDLMCLFPPDVHPHGMDAVRFTELFTPDLPVVFAFHGYQRAIHEIIHGRPNPERFHVRGFVEQGTTTTPFDIVVLNGMSRFHLCIEALRRAPRPAENAEKEIAALRAMIDQAVAYSMEHMEDSPEFRIGHGVDPLMCHHDRLASVLRFGVVGHIDKRAPDVGKRCPNRRVGL